MSYDVIVIGGGHLETIGQMSCNPAIGGIAKGTVVREVDALGGIMGRAADLATIQFRMLNQSKGPAVWAPRAQCDRGLYRRAVRSLLERWPFLHVVQGMVDALELEGSTVAGVRTSDGRRYRGRTVILTAGTFLRGEIHIGTDTRIGAGRAGEAPSVKVAQQLVDIGLTSDRFKTGTPPRIDGRTVDFTQMERQDGTDDEYRFSHFERLDRPDQRPCWVSWAGAELKEIIHRSLHQSALYGGRIAGRGPRYCPSIEDKVVKFPDAERHQVFLEPEGLDTSELYVNGLSTSLPVETQLEFLRAVPGLSGVRMTRPGYAIEYDYYPPHQLTPWLEVKSIDGLFLAGQVNGTTGYEEAAGQGVVAGINAARRAKDHEPIVLGRGDGYIGVLVDDLVTRGVDEPYRLFTSRSEFRLLLRQDNALKRLAPLGERLGMLSSHERQVLEDRLSRERELLARAEALSISPAEANAVLESSGQGLVREPQRIADLARRPHVSLRDLFNRMGDEASMAPDEAWMSVEIELKYEGYLERERVAAQKMAQLAGFRLPLDLPYLSLQSLSTEARQKLHEVRPESLAQAGRIPGVSPSDLQNLVSEVVRRGRSAA